MNCGTDIIEIDRIKDAIDKNGDVFLNKVFTKNEIDYCEKHGNNKYQHYAARFAAKEAVSKLLGTGFIGEFDLTEIEVQNDEFGKPEVILIGRAKAFFETTDMKMISISISHCKEYATSIVIGY